MFWFWHVKVNEMNAVLGHLCAHIGQTGQGESPEDGEMNEMALPSRHKIQIPVLAVWGRTRYLSVTEVPHNIESLRESGEETFCLFEIWMPERGSNPRFPTSQAGGFNRRTGASAWTSELNVYGLYHVYSINCFQSMPCGM